MGVPPNDKEQAEESTTLEEKLRRLAVAFKDNLAMIREFASGDSHTHDAKDFAADGTRVGGPKKHVIAATFACWETELASLFGRVRWRCSMSINKKTKISKVLTILNSVCPYAKRIQDQWPKIAEYMHDYSAANYAITEVTGKTPGFVWPPDKSFKLLVAAESETGGKSFNIRRNLVTRDLVKLCLTPAEVKVLVYKGYEEERATSENRQTMLDAIVETVRRCYEGQRPGGWLLFGLLGKWPTTQSVYIHTLTPDNPGATPRDW